MLKIYNTDIATNKIEEIIIANDVGTINLSLFKKTPLNNSSSHMGETNTVDINPPIPASEVIAKIENIGANINDLNPGIWSSAKIDK